MEYLGISGRMAAQTASEGMRVAETAAASMAEEPQPLRSCLGLPLQHGLSSCWGLLLLLLLLGKAAEQ